MLSTSRFFIRIFLTLLVSTVFWIVLTASAAVNVRDYKKPQGGNRADGLGPTRSVDRQTPFEAALHGSEISSHYAPPWRDSVARTQFFRAEVAARNEFKIS